MDSFCTENIFLKTWRFLPQSHTFSLACVIVFAECMIGEISVGLFIYTLFLENIFLGTRGITRWLKAFVALAEDPSLFPTQMVSYNLEFQGIQCPILTSVDSSHAYGIHADKILIHIKSHKSFENFLVYPCRFSSTLDIYSWKGMQNSQWLVMVFHLL